jgi:phenylacetate-CoA ligase
MNVDWFSPAVLYDLQNARFQQVIPHIFATPFYRSKLEHSGIKPNDIRSLDDIRNLPFTTKVELRQTTPMARSPFSLSQVEYFFTSSGTTGAPTGYCWTTNDTTVLREAGARAMHRINVQPDDVALILSPMNMSIMWYCMIQQYNAVGAGVIPLGVQSPEDILAILAQYPVTIIITLPVIATRLFDFLSQQSRYQRDDMALRYIHCGGDFLSESRRRRIEEMWQVKCYNFFGMSEIFGPLAGESSLQRGMHFLADYVYIEVLNPVTYEPVQSGEVGVAVYTTLWEKGSPLLRYWSDDYVTLDLNADSNGCSVPRIYYLGRPASMIQFPHRWLFSSQLEEQVLQFPVGNEYYLVVLSNTYARLVVEQIPEIDIPVEAVRQNLATFLDMSIELECFPPGTLARDIPKPQRIIDQREKNANDSSMLTF